MSTQIYFKIHNFGVYRKGGKRCILQLDFPGRMILIIQKGHIKKSQNFDGLQNFDAEEGLHISLKFRNGEIDFDTDNTEEKYTICHLLALIIQICLEGDDESIKSGKELSPAGTDIIKEAVLEKKGNTAIATWNKRRVRLKPGEFSYYKPGEELALDIVQLWQDNWEIQKHGKNGFTVMVRNKIYSFRVPSEYKALHMTQIVRDEWVMAFQQAFNQVPSTAKMFDQCLNEEDNSSDSEHIYDVTPDMDEDVPVASVRDVVDLPVSNLSQGKITAHVTVHLNYIDQSAAVPRESVTDKCRSTDKLQTSLKDTEVRPPYPASNHSQLPSVTGQYEDTDAFSGSAAALREKLAKQGGKSSSLKAYRAQYDFNGQEDGTEASVIGVLKSYCSQDTAFQQNDVKQLSDGSANKRQSLVTGTRSSNDSSNETKISVSSTRDYKSPKQKKGGRKNVVMPPPPPLPLSSYFGSPSGAPPLPPLSPPPVLPSTKSHSPGKLEQTSNVKLKQVHWVKVSSNQIAASMWRDASDMTNRLDLAELESEFSVQEKKAIAVKPKPQEEKEMLIDSKRAQNLGILFCGLKPESLSRLIYALNSTSEVDSFPADKLATLKRYQPTTEDQEMYKAFTDRRDSLHHVDHFMLELCEVPCLSLRLDLTLTLWEFPDRYVSLEEEVNDLLNGCEEILTSSQLTTVLEYILAIGNYMNAHWNAKQRVQGFQISSIEKILSVKGRDSQTTLCTYLVRQLKKTQPELINWSDSMRHVTKCTRYSVKAVGAEIDVLKNDMQKINRILKTLRSQLSYEDRVDKKYQVDVQNFIVEYDRKLDLMDIKYAKVTDKNKQMLARFGEVASKSESVFSHINLLIEKFQQAADRIK